MQEVVQSVKLFNPNHDSRGQFAPAGGGSGGGTSPSRMARIERQAARAEAHGEQTRQCAHCGKMLNGPMKGTKLPLPHKTPSGTWSHGACPSCARNWVAQYRALRAGKQPNARIQAWSRHGEAMKADQSARIAKYVETHVGDIQQHQEATPMRQLIDLYRQRIAFSEGTDGKKRSWIMMMPEGDFEHPEYGKIHFTRAKLLTFKENFDQRVRKIDIAFDADHKASQGDSRSTGWLERLELRPAQGDNPAGLWGCVCWTPYGAQLLNDDTYRYFSPEFGTYTDEATGDEFHDVIIGGALTNRPFLKVMPAIKLAEISTRPWASVDKSALPASCYLWPEQKKLPVYEGDGAGGRGKLNKNAVKAAYAALHGARTGTPMSVPSNVRARVVALYHQVFGSTQATERAQMRMKGKSMATDERFMLGLTTTLKPKGSSTPAKASKVQEYDPSDIDDATGFDDSETDDDSASMDDSGSDDDNEAMDDSSDDDSESYDDGGDDSDDAGDSSAPMASKRGGKKMSFGGKKAAPFAKGGGRAKMSEAQASRQLAEVQQRYAEQQQQLAEMSRRVYAQDVATLLGEWRSGKTMTFSATEVAGKQLPKTVDLRGKAIQRTRTVALTPRAERAISDFLLRDGYQMSERRRSRVLDLIQVLLSERATVDTTRYGNSFDQEARQTVRRGGAHLASDAVGGDLVALAESLAHGDGKDFQTLDAQGRVNYMLLAEQQG